MKSKFKPRKDRYQSVRGGKSKLLNIICTRCNNPLLRYQKDGDGALLRLYLDRIVEFEKSSKQSSVLECGHCNQLIGKLAEYKKESRMAYMLIRGSIKKQPTLLR